VATLVSVGEIVEAFGHSKAAFKLMIIDACRSGNTSGAFAALKPSQGVMLLQSSESGESSLEVDGVIGGEVLQGGLFSIALQEGLQGKGVDASGNITLLSLAAYAMKRTPVLAALLGEKQTPHMQGNLTDIVLVPKDKVGAGATAIAGGTPPSGNMDEARKRREDAVKEARTTIDVAIQRLIAAELEKVEKANQNPNLNPFDNSDLDQKIAKTILELIQGSRNLEIVLSQATAKYEMEELVRELITIPVQTALKDARTQWEKELIARQEREEEEKRVMAEAVKESLSDITKISQPDDIYAFAKDKNILARKDSVGNHEFGVKGVWLGENALGKDIYDKLKKVGKYLEAGVDPTRYDELEKKARSILNTPANAEIYCVKTPGGDYKYTPEQRNAAAVQMMRDAYGDGRLLKDENGVKRFKPSKEVLDEFEQMLAVLKIEYQGKREVDKTVVNAMLKENKKLVEDKYLISDDELKDKEKQVDNDISGKSNQVMTDFYIKLKTDYGREVVEQCAKEVIDDLKNANIPGFSEERATKYERFYMKLSSKLLLIGKENPYYGAVINNNFLNKGTAL
ncbi:MAG: hypothetical protein FWH27_10010, partial [Planctomycetaceae bacterium]|nr:hypothetical protein [Planctomycetaceae bacterium]